MESSSLTTLLATAEQAMNTHLRLKIVVADNTPGGQTVSGLPKTVEYWAYPENPGLAQPYNDAVAVAAEQGFEWLLTLDQDTCLPESFLPVMANVTRLYAGSFNVAALVPRIKDTERLISPFCYVGGFLPVVLPMSTRGIAPPHTSALNSASLLRVRLLEELGGYDPAFPLHNSDTRLYQRLNEIGKRVAIADVVVLHEYSILRREERMSPDRYRFMLRDECGFWDRHMGFLGRVERMARLLGRYAAGVLRRESPVFQRITAAEIQYRLLTRRATRIRDDHGVVAL